MIWRMTFHPEHLLQLTLVLALPHKLEKVTAASSDVFWGGQTAFPNPVVSHHHGREELRGAGCVESLEEL